MKNGKCNLYRHWGEDGTLLYVGISLSAVHRLGAHMERSHWSEQIANVTIETFDSRADALAAEKVAIQSEMPLHNKAHSLRITSDNDMPSFPEEFTKAHVDEHGEPCLIAMMEDVEWDLIEVEFGWVDGIITINTSAIEYLPLTQTQLDWLREMSELAQEWADEWRGSKAYKKWESIQAS